MPNQPEVATYDAAIYQIQATDDVIGAVSGGPAGLVNTPLLNLANRTGWLKAQIAALVAALTGYAPLNSPPFTGNPTAPTPPQGDNSGALVTTNWLVSNPPVIVSSGGSLARIDTYYGASTNACVAYQKFPNGRVEFYFHNIVFSGAVVPSGGTAKVIFAVITLPFTLRNGVFSAVFNPTDIGGSPIGGVTPEVTITVVASTPSVVVLACQGPNVTNNNNQAVSGTVVGF